MSLAQENNLKWKSEQNARQLLGNAYTVNAGDDDDDDDEHVERGSISSESSGADNGGIALSVPNGNAGALDAAAGDETGSDWQANDEIEQIVKELPDSANVLEALTTNDFTRKLAQKW